MRLVGKVCNPGDPDWVPGKNFVPPEGWPIPKGWIYDRRLNAWFREEEVKDGR